VPANSDNKDAMLSLFPSLILAYIVEGPSAGGL